ncbi:hypothetical protein SAMN05660653_00169 [Desulfonatronum thiosulfatophilum]|uniref:Permuted papain-like amidase enzyme, YaeF/YiiX, C92 family n=1 Tax=Desulfonatronum thiosulfatophilum TaxID=617002 RepID=A0A1G6A5Y5_9BACT|nr:hypothetical protein [Desulfonatronum thiosulfatophilum]SDB03706.1 hypothetical protein SAMN05660653_00169 [Desulfonatronum thiosulfatophilum]
METPKTYKEIRPLLRTGDCVLWQSRGLVPWIIQRFTAYSHAALVVRLDEYCGLKDRIFLVEAVSKGLVLSLLSGRIPATGKGRAFIFQPRTLYGYSQDKIRSDALTATARGVGYDFKGLFANVFGRVSTDAKRYFCSEVVWRKWDMAGVLRYDNLTESGQAALKAGQAPRPGDLPLWVNGTAREIVK